MLFLAPGTKILIKKVAAHFDIVKDLISKSKY